MIKKLLYANKEYLLLFFVLIALGTLLCVNGGVSQTARDITVTTFYPYPFGEFAAVTLNRLEAVDDPNFYISPGGLSRFTDLYVQSEPFDLFSTTSGNISIGGMIRGVPGTGVDEYYIDLNGGAVSCFSVMVAEDIVMGAPTPPPAGPGTPPLPIGGKHVYDISEGMPVIDAEAGDVVIINPGEKFGLKKVSQKLDARIAGVISTEPKLYMGSGSGNMPLALAGIVKCNVSSENGSIKRGDLLVSSSTPGHAMRADARRIQPGMLIGKALQNLKKGTGKIHILVNKQ